MLIDIRFRKLFWERILRSQEFPIMYKNTITFSGLLLFADLYKVLTYKLFLNYNES